MVSSISMCLPIGNHGLDLAAVSLGVGLLERNQLFGLGGLRLIGQRRWPKRRRRRVAASPRAARGAQPAQSDDLAM